MKSAYSGEIANSFISKNNECYEGAALTSETVKGDTLSVKEINNSENHTEIAASSIDSTEVDLKSGICSNKEAKEMLSSQEIAERAHKETKDSVLSQYGEYMSSEHLSLLESDETRKKLIVINCEEYAEAFPKADMDVFGHCDSEGNIIIKDISQEIVNHVSTHETMHLCANREIKRNIDGSITIISGLRECKTRGNGEIYTDYDMGVNEGMTEMYTMRELLKRKDADAAYAANAYSESRMWSERMEMILGKDKMEKAFFGGRKQELIEEFNRLNGNKPGSWNNYSRDIDIIEFGKNPKMIKDATVRISKQFIEMAHNKFNI